jgi:hypothetical protein
MIAAAPARSARSYAASTSGTYRYSIAAIGFAPGRASAIITTELPIATSACPTRPSGLVMRSMTLPPNTAITNSMTLAAPSTMMYGVTVW